jgi:hypothetical protein
VIVLLIANFSKLPVTWETMTKPIARIRVDLGHEAFITRIRDPDQVEVLAKIRNLGSEGLRNLVEGEALGTDVVAHDVLLSSLDYWLSEVMGNFFTPIG